MKSMSSTVVRPMQQHKCSDIYLILIYATHSANNFSHNQVILQKYKHDTYMRNK